MRRFAVTFVIATALLCDATFIRAQSLGPAPSAGASPNGSISGAVTSADGVPIGNADVSLEGSEGRSKARTAADGSFTIPGVVPGFYTVVVTRSGFDTARQSDIVVVHGTTVDVKVALVQSSFSSLRVIGSVSTSANAKSQINTSTSSVSKISNQTFLDQGQPQIATILNQTPGIVTTHVGANGASQGSDEEVQIRGGLAYETESLIDGHPLSIGASGNYNPILLAPGMLQDIEVVKGPGAFPTEINGAINGTVNYRTLEPTRIPEQSVTIGSDQYGGVTTTLQATGSLRNHFIDYAFAYATNGTPGAFLNYPAPSSTTDFSYLGGAPYTINGRQIAQPLTGFAGSATPQYVGFPRPDQARAAALFLLQPAQSGLPSKQRAS